VTPEDLRELLIVAGLPCRVRRSEVVVVTCYFCGNEKSNLELSAEKGVYKCWACNASGRLSVLLEQITGQVHHIPVQRGPKRDAGPRPGAATPFQSKPVAEVPSAVRYLERRRGLSVQVATEYGLVVCMEPGHLLYSRLAIPARDFWTGVILGWIGRSYTGGHPKYLSTLERKVITGWRVRDAGQPTVLVEGHLDGIAVHRAGYHAAVLSGTGSSGVEEWAARVPPLSPVVVLLDGGAQTEATRLFWMVSKVRERVSLLPLIGDQDPAALGPAVLRELITQRLITTDPQTSKGST
jgi:hypothetical protein